MQPRLGALVVLAACGSPPAAPPVPLAQPPSEWLEPTTLLEQQALAREAPARRFVERHGGRWYFDFDPVLATPRALRGSGLALPVAGTSDAELARAALGFVADHAELFGTSELVFDGAVADRELISIALDQHHHGIPVVGGHLGLVIARGRLVLVQGATYPESALCELDVAPRVDRAAALATLHAARFAGGQMWLGERAAAAIPSPRSGDRDHAELAIVPVRGPGTVHYRLAWQLTAWRGEHQLVAFVDAHDGELFAAYDGNRYEYPGKATHEVDQRTVGDDVVTLPAGYLRLSSGRGVTTTDGDGAFRFPGAAGPLLVTANLRGAYVDVWNLAGPDARFVGMMLPDSPYGLRWDEARSTPEERDVFRAVNDTNRYVATVFPSVAWMERPLIAKVNHPYTCNAFWNGSSINFFVEGDECNNTGRIFDVVAHEWGHGIDQNLPGQALDGALGEFIGDLISFVQTRSPLLGPGFFKSGKPARDLEDPDYQCYDPAKREVHAAGHLLGAVVWDILQDLERAGVTGEPLKRLMLRPMAIAQTRSQWYAAMLAVDDADGNLANGTPHECLIYNQFKAHSCGGTRWPGIPAEDPPHCVTD